jgi:predicted outer membrane protein
MAISRTVRTSVGVICASAAVWTFAVYIGDSSSPSRPATSTTAGTAPSQADAAQLTPTSSGPLSAADVKLLTIVRQTSLREIITSQWAEQRTANPMVLKAAQMMISQHTVLQSKDLDVAEQLGLTLPDKPSADMQTGIDRMRTETGTTFDTDYVNTLRQAHAQALILLAKVRADTRNSLVRPFAELANGYITNHIQMLEATGDVDYAKLPIPTT